MPQEFVVKARPGSETRTIIVRALLVVLGYAMLMALRILEREHPTRIFIEGRLSESIPAIERSLDRGGVRNWLGEAIVGTSTLFVGWTVIDFLSDTIIGPIDLGSTIVSLFLP